MSYDVMGDMWDSLIKERDAALARAEAFETALRDLVAAFRNSGDGGEFEDGEVPALDRARALLSQAARRA